MATSSTATWGGPHSSTAARASGPDDAPRTLVAPGAHLGPDQMQDVGIVFDDEELGHHVPLFMRTRNHLVCRPDPAPASVQHRYLFPVWALTRSRARPVAGQSPTLGWVRNAVAAAARSARARRVRGRSLDPVMGRACWGRWQGMWCLDTRPGRPDKRSRQMPGRGCGREWAIPCRSLPDAREPFLAQPVRTTGVPQDGKRPSDEHPSRCDVA